MRKIYISSRNSIDFNRIIKIQLAARSIGHKQSKLNMNEHVSSFLLFVLQGLAIELNFNISRGAYCFLSKGLQLLTRLLVVNNYLLSSTDYVRCEHSTHRSVKCR